MNSPASAPSRAAVRGVALTALACGACCVLPFAVSPVVLATAGSLVAATVGTPSWVLLVAALLVGVAWLWIVWRSHRTRRRPARTTLGAMHLATGALVVVVAWRYVRPLILRLLAV